MKQVFITGKNSCEIREVPNPVSSGDWVVVRIRVAPMCTEYKQFVSGEVNHPLGHEAAGEVVDVAQSGPVRVGDRVVVMPQYPCGQCQLCLSGEYIHCQNTTSVKEYSGNEYGDSTYAELILKPSMLLPVIPEDISYEHASMLCCGLGPAYGAMDRMQVNEADTVLITGMGPVGLGGVINAKYRGAKVIAVSGNPYRSNLATQLGADHIIEPDASAKEKVMDLTHGLGASISIDCAGAVDAQRLLINSTARNGKIAFVGESGSLDIKVSDDLIRNGLTLYGIWHYNYGGIRKLFDLVRQENSKIDMLITHRFPLDKVAEAWKLQQTHQCGKVVLTMV
jgi:L-iditol 2-dehydrogenase